MVDAQRFPFAAAALGLPEGSARDLFARKVANNRYPPEELGRLLGDIRRKARR